MALSCDICLFLSGLLHLVCHLYVESKEKDTNELNYETGNTNELNYKTEIDPRGRKQIYGYQRERGGEG